MNLQRRRITPSPLTTVNTVVAYPYCAAKILFNFFRRSFPSPLLLLLIILIPNITFAAAFNDAADGNWNDGATWGNVSPGVQGVDYPGPSDTATIDSHIVTVTTNQSTGGVTVNGGTLNLGANQITVTGAWTYTSGTIDAGTSTVVFASVLTITGSHSLHNVTFDPNSVGNVGYTIAAGTILTVTNELTLQNSNVGKIGFNTGTIAAQGDIVVDGDDMYVSAGANLATLLINGTIDQDFTMLNATRTTGGLMTLQVNKSAGTLFLHGTIRTYRNWTVTAGTIDPGTSTVVFASLTTEGRTITGSHTLNNVIFDSNSASTMSFTIAAGTVVSALGDLTIDNSNSGIMTILTGAIAVHGDVTVDALSLQVATSHNTAVLQFVGTGDQTFTVNNATRTTGAMTNIDVNKSSGTLFLVGTIRTARNWTVTAGVVDPGVSTVIFASISTEGRSITGSHILNNVIFDSNTASGMSFTIGAATTITIEGDLTIDNSQAAAMTFTGGTLAVAGDISVDGPNIATGTTTLLINGTGDQELNSQNSTRTSGNLLHLNIDKPSGTLLLSGTIRTARDWTYTNGTLDADTSTVIFTTSTNQSRNISGSHSLNNVTFDTNYTGSGMAFTFIGGTTLTVKGDLTIDNTQTALMTFTGGTINAEGDIFVDGPNIATGTTTLLINGTGDQELNSQNSTRTSGNLLHLNIDKPSGTLLLSGTIRTARDWTYTNGTLDAGTSTVIFTTSTTQSRNISGSHSLNNVIFDTNYTGSGMAFSFVGGTILTVKGDLTIDNTLTAGMAFNDGTLAAEGNILVDGPNISSGSATLLINGTGDQTLTGQNYTRTSGNLLHLNIDKPSGTLFLDGTLRTGRNWTYTTGTIDPGTSRVIFADTLSITGSHTLNEVIFDQNNNNARTFTIVGGATLTIKDDFTIDNTLVGGITLTGGTYAVEGDVVIDGPNVSGGTASLQIKGAGDQTLTSLNSTRTSGNILHLDVDKPSGTLFLVGTIRTGRNWTHTNGTIDPGTSTVVFADTLTITGSHSLYNFIFDTNNNNARTFTLAGGTVVTALGEVILANTGSGTITINDGTFSVHGNLTTNNRIATTGTTAITLTGGNAQTINTVNLPRGTFTINKDPGTAATLAANLVANGAGQDLTITSGILDLGGYNLTVADVFSNNDTLRIRGNETLTLTGGFDTNSGTVVVNGTSSVTLPSSLTTYYNLTIDESGTSNPTFTLPDSHVTINGVLNVADGTLAFDNDKNLTVSDGAATGIAITVGAEGRLANTGTGDLTIAGDVANAGTIAFDSSDNAGNGIAITSNNTTPRDWAGAGTFRIVDTNVSYQTADSGTPTEIKAFSSTDGGNNNNWNFAPTTTISGTVYSDEGVTSIGAGKTVAISINGAAAAATDDTDASGNYEFSGLVIIPGDKVAVYIDGEAEKAITATISDGNDLTDFDLYWKYVIVRNDDPAGAGYTTNADLAAADNGDADIPYVVVGGNLTVNIDTWLLVWSGGEFRPGGNVTVPENGAVSGGGITINGTWRATGTEAITVANRWNAGSGVFIAANSVVTFKTGNINFAMNSGGADDDHAFYDVVIQMRNEHRAFVSATHDMKIKGSLVFGVGRLQPTTDIYLDGDFNISAAPGAITSPGSISGKLIMSGSAQQTISNSAGSSHFFPALKVSNTSLDGVALTDPIRFAAFELEANTKFDTDSNDLYVGITNQDSHWIVDPTASFISGDNTVYFGLRGMTVSTGGIDAEHDFNNVVIEIHSAYAYDLIDYDMQINGSLTLTSGFLRPTANIYLEGDLNIASTSVGMESGTGDIIFSGNDLQTINNPVGEAQAVAEVQIANGAEVVLADAVTFSVTTINSGGVFDLEGNNFTATGSFTNNGTFVLNGNETFTTPTLGSPSTVFYKGTSSITLPAAFATYYNLTIDESGAANPTFTLPDSNVTVNGVLSVIDGTLAFDNDKNLTVNDGAATGTAVSVGADGRLVNTGTGDLTIAGNVANAGVISFNSSDDAGNAIVIASNNLTPRDWAGAGTFSMIDVAASYQTANSGTPTEIRAYSSTDNGNNNNWNFAPTSTISGTVYIDEGVTNIGAGKTVAISINGAAAAATDDTDASGNYELPGLAITPGDRVVVYIDGETERGTTVTIANGNDLSGLDLYQNHVIIRNDDPAGVGYTTNADLAAGDNGDADIRYNVAGGNLTVDAGYELYIWTGDEFRPGGDVANGNGIGGLVIKGIFTASGTETITVYALWDASDGVFNAANSHVIFVNNHANFSAISGGVDDDHDFYDLTITSSQNRGFLLSAGDIEVDNDLVLGGGILGLTNSIYVNGDFSVASSIGQVSPLFTGDIVMSGSGLQTISNPTGETDVVADLRITNSSVGGVVLADPINVAEFIMEANAVFDAAGNDMGVGLVSRSTVWTVDPTASFTTGNNTVTFVGHPQTITTGGTDSLHDFHNVLIAKTSNQGFILNTGYDMQINGSLEIVSGVLTLTDNIYIMGDLSITSTGLWSSPHTIAGSLIMAGTGLQTISNPAGDTDRLPSIRITNTSNDGVVLADPISFFDFVMEANTKFDAAGNEMSLGAHNRAMNYWTVDPTAKFISGNNTVRFKNYAHTVSPGGTDADHDFHNVSIEIGTSRRFYLDAGYDMQINGSLTLDLGTSGIMNLTNNIYLNGDLHITNTYGSAADLAGSIIFSGSSPQTVTNSSASAVRIAKMQVANGAEVILDDFTTFFTATINSGGIFDLDGNNFTATGVFTNDGTLRLHGSETPTFSGAGGFDEDSGTVEFTGTGTYAAGLPNAFGDQFYNLTFNGSGGVWTLDANTTVANNFTATAGTLDINDLTFAISGNTVINGGTVATGTNTVTFGNAGGDSVTISGGELLIESDVPNTDIVTNAGTWTNSGGTISYMAGSAITQNLLTGQTAYHNLTVNSDGSTYTFPDSNVVVDGVLTVTDGTLAFDNDKSLTVNDAGASGTAVSVANGATFSNTGTGDLVLGGDVANGGAITFNSSDDAGNGIAISSSDGVTARQWSGAGTFSMTDVTASDQSADISDPEYILTTSSTDGGDNTNWVFPTGTLTALAVTPASLSKGATTTATVSFTTANVVASDGKIKITFPAGFDVSGVTTATSAADIDGTLGVAVAGQVVTITRSGGTALAEGAVIDDLVLSSIVNPDTAGATGTFAVSTTDSADTVFDSGTAAAVTIAATVEISGTVYTDEGVTNIGAGKTVAISINGAAAAGTADTDASGRYTIAGLTIADGDRVAVYLDGETEKAVAVTVARNTSHSIPLYRNFIIVRNDYSGGAGYTTVADLAASDNGDADIMYNVAATLTTQPGHTVLVWTGDEFRPGANVENLDNGGINGGGIKIDGIWRATGTETIRAVHNWNVTNGIFIAASSVVTFKSRNDHFRMRSGGIDGDHDFHDVVVDLDGQFQSFSVLDFDMKVSNSFVFAKGHLSPTKNIYAEGDFTVTGNTSIGWTPHSHFGELIFSGSSLQTIANPGGTTAVMPNVRIANTSLDGVVLDDPIRFTDFRMEANSKFDAAGNNLEIGNNNRSCVWAVDPMAEFITGGNTVTFYSSMSISTGGADSDHDFDNVIVNSNVNLNSADMQINGSLTLYSGSLNLTNNIYLEGDLNITSTGVGAEAGSGDIIFSGSSVQTVNNAVGETQAVAEVQIANGAAVVLADPITFSITTIDSGGILDLDGNNFTATGVFTNNGTLRLDGGETVTFSGAGGFDEDSGTVEFTGAGNYAAGLPNAFGDLFYNLTFNGSGGTWTLDANTTVSNNFTATAGTLDVNDYTFTVNGNTAINGGTVATGTNTVTFGNAGGDSVTISGGELRIESDVPSTDIVTNAGSWTNSGGTISYAAGSTITQNLLTAQTAYYNLTVNSDGSTYTFPDSNVVVDGVLSVADGTLVFDNDKNLTINDAAATGTALSVANGATLSNAGTGNLTLGGDVVNDGAITFNSSDDAGNAIAIASTAGARTWSGAGSFSMTDVAVANQTADLSDPEYILVASSTDSGGNTNWVFPTGAITNGDVTPASLATSASGNVTVVLTNENVIPSDGKIVVVFPTGFDVSGVSGASSAADIDGSLAVGVSGQTVTITRSGGTAIAEGTDIDDLIIAGVVNPVYDGATGDFTVSTTDASNTTFDTATVGGVTITGGTDYVWTGAGDGVTWADEDNWNVGVGYPSNNEDTATVNSTASAITTAGAITVGAYTQGGTFSGSVTLGGAFTVDDAGGKSGDFTLSAGTVDTLHNSLSIDRDFTIVAGLFNARNSTITVFRNVDIASAPVFTRGLSTIILAGSGTISAPHTDGLTHVTQQDGITTTLAGRVYIRGVFTSGNATSTIQDNGGARVLTVRSNNIVHNGATWTATSAGRLVIESAGATIGGGDYGNTRFVITSTNTSDLAGNVTTTGSFELSEPTTPNTTAVMNLNGFDLAVGSMTVGYTTGTMNGTFNVGTSTVIIAGDLRIRDASAGRVNTFDSGSGQVFVGGSFIVEAVDLVPGVFTAGTASVTFNATGGTPTITSAGNAFNNVVFNDAGNNITFTLEDAFHVNGDLTITGGSLDTKAAENNSIAIGGNFVNDDILITNTSTVTFDGAAAQTIDAGGSGTGNNDPTNDFHNVVISNTAAPVTLVSELEVDGTLTVNNSAVLDVNGQAFDLNGTLSNNGTLIFQGGESVEIGVMDSDSGTVVYDGTASVTLPAITNYYNLTFDESGAADPTYTLPDSNVTVNGVLNVTDGALAFDDDKSLTVNDNAATGTAVSIAAAGSVSNAGTGDLVLGGDVANAGVVTFNSSDDAGNGIAISSTAGAREWNGAGTFSFTDVAVSDQTTDGSSPEYILAASSTDSGGNTNWVFPTGTLTDTAVTPASLAAGDTGNVTVEFTTENLIPTNGKIVVVFPADFDVSGVSGATSAADIDGSLAVGVSGQTVTITRSGGSLIAGGAVIDDLIIAGVENPAATVMTGTFTISTTDASNTTFDTASADGVGIVGAADYVWTGAGDGTSWTDPANWDVGVGYPDANDDTATINSTADVITTPGGITIGAYTQGGTFSGSVTLGGAFTTSSAGGESGDFSLSAGVFDTNNGASYTVTIDRDWTITDGNFTARNSTINVGRNIEIASSVTRFTKGNSTVNIVGSGTIVNASHANAFHNVVQANGITTTLVGILYVRDGGFTSGDATSTITFDGVSQRHLFIYGAAVLTNNGATWVNVLNSQIQIINATIGGGDYGNMHILFKTGTSSLAGDIETTGNIYVPSFAGPSTISILETNNFAITATDFLVGMPDGTINGVVNAGSSTFNISRDFTIYDASAGRNNTFNAQSASIFIGRNLLIESADTIAGTFVPGTSTVTFNATSGTPTVTSAGNAFNDVVFDDAGNDITFTLEDSFDVNGNLTITGGTLDTKAAENNSINIAGDFVNNDIFVSQSGTVTFDGTGAQTVDAGGSGTGNNDPSNDFNNIVISNTAAAVTLLSELEVDGTLTIDASAVLDVDGQDFDLNGTLVNNGTLILQGGEDVEIGVMDSDSGTVLYDGTASVTIPSAITDYYNLTFDESGASDPTYTLPDANITVNGVLNVTDGALAYDNDKNVTVNDNGATGTAVTVAATGSIANTGTGDLTLGGDVANDGAISFNSSDDAGNGIVITTDDGSTARTWTGDGSFSFVDVAVSYQIAANPDPEYIVASSSTDSGNNTSWVFPVGTLADPAVTPETLWKGATGDATIEFTLDHMLPTDGKIVITFPAGFDVSGVSGASSAGDIDGALGVGVVGQVVTITRSGGTLIAEGAVVDDLVIVGVKNPTAAGATGTFAITTTSAADLTFDTATAAAVTIADGTDYIWTGGGDGVSWADEDNWNVGYGYPDDNKDTATVNSTASVITTAGAITVGAYTQGGTFSGSVTLGGTFTVDDAGGESGDFLSSVGTFDTRSGNNYALNIDRDFILSAGTFFSRNSTITVRRNVQIVGTSFDRGGSTLVLAGDGSINASHWNGLSNVVQQNGVTTTVISMYMRGQFITGDATSTIQDNGTSGGITIIGIWGDPTSIVHNGATWAATAPGRLRISSASAFLGAGDFGNVDFAINGMTLLGNVETTGNTFLNVNNGANTSVTFTTANHNFTTHNLTIGDWGSRNGVLNAGSSTITVTGNLTIADTTAGRQNIFNAGSANVFIGGNLIVENADAVPGTFTPGTSTVTFNATSGTPTITSSGNSFNNVIFNDSGNNVTFTLEDAFNVDGDLTITGGTLDAKVGENNNINIGGDFVNNDTFISRSNTVTFDGASAQSVDAGGTGIGNDDTSSDFNNITIANTAAAVALTGELEVDGTLTINSNAVLDVDGQDFDLNGTLVNNGTLVFQGGESVEVGVMDSDSGLVLYDGTASVTITDAITSYYNLTFDESGASDPSYTLPDIDVTVNGVLSVADGALVYDNDKGLTVNNNGATGTAVTVAAASSISNTGTGDLTLGGDVANAGTITFNSSDDAGNGIAIASTGAAREWAGSGTFSMTDVTVSDQSADLSDPEYILTASSTDGGGNTNWVFPVGALSAETVTPASLATSATGNVTVSFTNEHVIPSSGKIVIVFPAGFDVSAVSGATSAADIDGSLAVGISGQTVTITRSGGTAIAEGTVIDDLNLANVTNPVYDGLTGDFTISTTDASNTTFDTVAADGVTITGGTDYVWTGNGDGVSWEDEDNWDVGVGYPSANVDTVTINSTSDTIVTAGAIAVGEFTTGGTFSGSITLGGAFIVDDAGGQDGDFRLLDGSFDTNSVGDYALTIEGDLVVAGALTANDSAITVGGSLDLTGATFASGGSLVNFAAVAGAPSIVSDGSSFHDVVFNDDGNNITFTLEDGFDVNGDLTITSGALDTNAAESNSISIGGDFINSGIFISNSGAVTFDGVSVQAIDAGGSGTGINDPTKDFHNVVISNTAAIISLVSEIEVDGALTINNGAVLDANGADFDLNGMLFNDGTLVFEGSEEIEVGVMDSDSGTVLYDGTGSLSISNGITTYYNLIFEENGAGDPTFTLPDADIVVNGVLSVLDATLAFDDDKSLTVNDDGATGTAIVIGAAGGLTNLGIGDLVLGGAVVNDGVVFFDSSDDAGDAISISSTVASAQRSWAGAGTFSFVDVEVAAQGVDAVDPQYIFAASSSDGGGNSSWIFAIGDLTDTSVVLDTLQHSTLTDVTVSFTTTYVIPRDGKIAITFPAGFDVSAVSGASSAGDIDGTLSVSVAGQVVTISRSGGTQLVEASIIDDLVIADVITPTPIGVTGSYLFATTMADDEVIDTGTAAGSAIDIQLYTVTVTVEHDAAALSGVTLESAELGDAITDGSGVYSWTNVAEGTSYTIRPLRAGYIFTPTIATEGSLNHNQSHEFIAKRLLSVSGRVTTPDGVGVAGVSINGGLLGVTSTNVTGYYSFNDIVDGVSYMITPSMTRRFFEPSNVSDTLNGTSNVHNFVVEVDNADGTAISGQVILDNLGKTPIAGVVVSDGMRNTTTDSNGFFRLEGMPNGIFTITASKDHHLFELVSPSNPITVGDNDIGGFVFKGKRAPGNDVYVMWNGFLGTSNIAELMNKSYTESLEVDLIMMSKVDVYGRDVIPYQTTIVIPPRRQIDVVLNELQGFEVDAYGILNIKTSHPEFDGRLSVYRAKFRGGHEFAYTVPFSAALRGNSAAIYNTYYPGLEADASEKQVYHWLTLSNLNTTRAHTFYLEKYGVEGEVIDVTHYTIGPLGRIDIEAGHVNPGPNSLGMIRIVPTDNSLEYMAQLNRYAIDIPTDEFEYSITLLPTVFEQTVLHAVISNQNNATSFIEIANLRDAQQEVLVQVRNNSGEVVYGDVVILAPFAQRHLRVDNILPGNSNGIVTLRYGETGAIAASAISYMINPQTKMVNAAYETQLRDTFGETMNGSFNMFLNMNNVIRVGNISNQPVSITLDVDSEDIDSEDILEGSSVHVIPPYSTKTITATGARDVFGLVSVTSSEPGAVVPEVLRLGESPNSTLQDGTNYDFGLATQAR